MATEKTTLARPYAKAAFEYALSQQAFSEWSVFLQTVAQVTLNEQVSDLLKDPRVDNTAKVNFYVDICGKVMSEKHKNFLQLLAEHDRLAILPEIATVYEAYRAEQEKTVEVDVFTFMPLTDQQEQSLVAALKNRLQREVAVKSHVDSALLGGAIVKAGDLVIDGSARGKLNKLRQAILA